jgi:hypothetical protein
MGSCDALHTAVYDPAVLGTPTYVFNRLRGRCTGPLSWIRTLAPEILHKYNTSESFKAVVVV